MSLSKKILLILLPFFLLMVAISLLAQRSYVYPAFAEIERQAAVTDFERVLAKFESTARQQDLLNKDWAEWDESYQFVQGKNPGFIDSNLIVESYVNSNFDFLFYFDTQLSLVWQGVLSADQNQIKENPEIADLLTSEIRQRFRSETDSFSDIENHFSDWTLIDNIPAYYSVRPILTSKMTGPVAGYLVRGSFVDADLIADFEKQSKVKFTVQSVSNPEQSMNDELTLTMVDDNTLAVTQYFFSQGRPVLFIQSYFPRAITGQGRVAVRYSLIFMIGLGVVLLTVYWKAIGRIVLRPILELTRNATLITDTRDYKKRAHVDSQDEIGTLAAQLNSMLEVIESREKQLQVALKKVNQLLVTDPLTQIANRLKFDSVSHREWLRMQREKAPLSVLMCDVDYFKEYNDQNGHFAGDECLRQVATLLNQSVRRPADLAARYGGEEFVILLPNTDGQGAEVVANNVIEDLRKLAIPHESSPEQEKIITVSLGIATCIPDAELSLQTLLTSADDALYRAKQQGRNRYQVG